MPVFEVSMQRQAIKATNVGATASGLGSQNLQTIAVCDVDLMHQSHISDEEDLRFQMPVAVYGLERDQHNGGNAYRWGEQALQHRRGVRFRLANVGSTSAIDRFQRLGYPICTVCGQSVSPLSSQKARDQFAEGHKERCGRVVTPVGFYADVVADALTLPACADQTVAYSVLESLRFAATRVLDMHMEDLQVLVIGHVDRTEVDACLWDPMPGGSGLLDKICERFPEIVAAAKEVVADCPSVCETACVDCLQTFRNGFYHKYLDRKAADERIVAWGEELQLAHAIPPKQPSREPEEGSHPVNEAERRLRHLLLAAGFEEGIRGQQIYLDRAIGSTTPDVIYRAAHHEADEGVCIYLDGLSAHLHGNPATATHDQRIRTWLRNNEHEVIEIAVGDLHDQEAMQRHFRKLAGYLGATDLREKLRSDRTWFAREPVEESAPSGARLRIVQPRAEDRYVTCVPLVPLKVAAGAFGEPQHLDDEQWTDWVELPGRPALRPGMFVAQVVGKSMEPAIPDGSYCVFAAPVEGSRQGQTVLVQLRDQSDPETGERYTVKRYESEKVTDDDGTWRHVQIRLVPNNAAFEPIVLTTDDEAVIAVIARFLKIVG